MGKKQARICRDLKTPFENASCGWEEYPRPQMKRESYLSLCGAWELSVRCGGTERPLGEIRVPFPPESCISGIGRALGEREQYIYRKSFTISEDFNRGRILLHFGAVDQIAEVFVNDRRPENIPAAICRSHWISPIW